MFSAVRASAEQWSLRRFSGGATERSLRVLVALAVPGLLAAGCYRPTVARCQVRCEMGTECPQGTSCSDGFCTPPGVSGQSCLAIGGDDGGLPRIDSAPVAVDDGGRPVDDMVAVPAGPFMMGCAGPPADRNCYSDEPLHTITLSAYQIDRTEVTQGAYALCVADGVCNEPHPALTQLWDPGGRPAWPVVALSRDMAAVYCAWNGKRLPTEAEWEKAARGDSDTRVYPWGSSPDPSCNMYARFLPTGCTSSGPSDAGSYPAGNSPYGAVDMAGNAWEWVSDWYDANYYNVSPSTDPQGPASGLRGILRGGGFESGLPVYLRVSNRHDVIPSDAYETYGVRCVRSGS